MPAASESVERSGLVRGLLPSVVAVAEGPVAQSAAELWPDEAQAVARAVETRRCEFAAGRTLARRALTTIGGPAIAILAGEGGAPVWPAGFVGSISHTNDYAAAAAASLGEVSALGIDVERVERLGPDLFRAILTPGEADRMNRLGADAQLTMAAVIFSAKESFYKLQYPLTAAWLGFQDVEIELDAAAGAFRVGPPHASPLLDAATPLFGRYAIRAGLVASAIWRPADMGVL